MSTCFKKTVFIHTHIHKNTHIYVYTSLPLFPEQLWPGVVVPDWVLSMDQIELNCNYAELNCLKLTVFTFNSVFKLPTYAKLNYLKKNCFDI